MTPYLKNIYFLLFIFSSHLVAAQNSTALTNVTQLTSVVDTVAIKNNHAKVLITWLNDTIELSTLIHPVKYNLDAMRKMKKDSSFTPTPEEEKSAIDFIKTASQNCFSYALQKYFTYHCMAPDLIFNKYTALSKGAIETIIENTFVKTNEFSTKKKKHFKDAIADGALIIFRNKHDWIIHAFYYENGLFYSKNGAWAAQEYKQMKDIFKRYWDTKLVQFYTLDTQKTDTFIARHE